MEYPIVVKTSQGSFYFVMQGCRLAEAYARNLKAPFSVPCKTNRCCSTFACLCKLEDEADLPLSVASRQETEDFWRTMDGYAAEASCKY